MVENTHLNYKYSELMAFYEGIEIDLLVFNVLHPLIYTLP